MALLKANTGIGTTNPTAALHVFGNSLVVGIVTASSFSGSGTSLTGVVTSITAGTGIFVNQSAGNVTITNTSTSLNSTLAVGNTSSYGMSVGVVTATSFVGSLSGNATSATYATSSGIATIAGYASTAGIATVAQNLTGSPNITVSSVNSSGIVTASSFSGSGANLTSLDATQLTSGTVPSARITASSGDFTVGQNLYVNGSLSVGGTSIILNAQQLVVSDKDIVVGYTTDTNNNDISNDNTANHGGISVASTVGSPLINIPLQVGVNSNPSTYKQLMWIKSGNYSGFGTDAWVFNYGVSIGNTSSVQSGSRLTVGAGFTVYDTYLDAIDVRARNINATGIITASSFSGNASSATYATSSGIATYATSSGIATYATSSGISAYATTAGVSTYASTSGISTVAQGLTGTPDITVGVVTATSYNGSGTNLTGIVTSIVAGTNITVSGSTGQVTINSTATGGGSGQATYGGYQPVDLLESILFS